MNAGGARTVRAYHGFLSLVHQRHGRAFCGAGDYFLPAKKYAPRIPLRRGPETDHAGRFRTLFGREIAAFFAPVSRIAIEKNYRWLSRPRPAPFAWQAQISTKAVPSEKRHLGLS